MKTFKQIHRYYFLGILFLTFILFLPLYLFLLKRKQCYPTLNRLRKIHSYIICYLSGFVPAIHYSEKLDTHKNYIYCANHTSNLDILLMCVIAKGNFHFIGKIELLENPILKLFFSTIDISVDRKSMRSSFLAFQQADQRIKQGMSLIIFPEGKIPDEYPPILAEFKNGPFRLAIENQTPIVALSFQNIWERMWDDGAKYGTSPGKCHIFAHPIIDTTPLDTQDADTLKERVYYLIKSKL